MFVHETSQLLETVTAVDGRVVDDVVVQAWFDVIGHLDLHTAKRALALARQDPDLRYLEPRHIVQFAKVIESRLAQARRVDEATRPRPIEAAVHYGAPRPANFDAMAAAASKKTGNRALFRAEVVAYEAQLASVGYHDKWTDSGRVLPPGM